MRSNTKIIPWRELNHMVKQRFVGGLAEIFIDNELYCGGMVVDIRVATNSTILELSPFVHQEGDRLVKSLLPRKMEFAAHPEFFREHLIIGDISTKTYVIIHVAGEKILSGFRQVKTTPKTPPSSP